MNVDIRYKTCTLDDEGESRNTRKRAATWMRDTLATLDDKDVLSTHFSEDNTSTTAWIIVRRDRTTTKEIS